MGFRADLMADLDQAMGFTIPERHARGRLARLGPVLTDILSAHNYPPAIERLLAEALVLTALFGAMLKGEGGQLTLQAQTESGVVKLLVCDFRDGELRGYVDFDKDRLAMYGKKPSLKTLMGKGYLAITFDQAASEERYQGIVPLDAPSLSEAAEHYFSQSEQIPSLVRIAVSHENGEQCVAGGILIQHLPEGEAGRDRIHTRLDHPEWEHVRILSSTVKGSELCDPDLPLETLVWRLFNEEQNLRNIGITGLTKGCRCDVAHIQDVLSRFPAAERAEMADQSGMISVDCAFCAKVFPISASVQ
jgi:molecular chaperone Hsp33